MQNPPSGSARYAAYGIAVQSELPLPEFAVSSAPAEATVRFGQIDVRPTELSPSGIPYHATEDEVCLFYEKAGKFLIRGGREIIIDPGPGVEERALRLLIVGPCFGALLQQRGLLALHASAVRIGDDGVAFLGGPRWGKSTLAATLQARGASVITDDIAAIALTPDFPIIQPAFPRLKLWPDAASSLGIDIESAPRLHPDFEKRDIRIPDRFASAPVPLRRVYVLAEDSTIAIRPISGQDAVIELVRHSYANSVLRGEAIGRHFRQCAIVAARVPIRRLQRPRVLAKLNHVAEMIEADCS